MSEPITRPEFDGAIKSLHRELHTMADNLGRQLGQILDELNAMRPNSAKLAVLEVRLEALETWKETNQRSFRAVLVGLAVSIAGHIATFLLKK